MMWCGDPRSRNHVVNREFGPSLARRAHIIAFLADIAVYVVGVYRVLVVRFPDVLAELAGHPFAMSSLFLLMLLILLGVSLWPTTKWAVNNCLELVRSQK